MKKTREKRANANAQHQSLPKESVEIARDNYFISLEKMKKLNEPSDRFAGKCTTRPRLSARAAICSSLDALLQNDSGGSESKPYIVLPRPKCAPVIFRHGSATEEREFERSQRTKGKKREAEEKKI